jgi:hypothetical protein
MIYLSGLAHPSNNIPVPEIRIVISSILDTIGQQYRSCTCMLLNSSPILRCNNMHGPHMASSTKMRATYYANLEVYLYSCTAANNIRCVAPVIN